MIPEIKVESCYTKTYNLADLMQEALADPDDGEEQQELPPAAASKPCTCEMTLLLAQGCQCGGN